MKSIYYIATLAIGTVLATSSCTKEESVAKPVITFHEIGFDNTGKVQQGGDLHLDVEIVAEGKIKTVTVELHPESGNDWEFDSVYTEFAGRKNADFHKHIEVPATAPLGHYHLHFIVTDNEGNAITEESEIEIIANDGTIVETDDVH